MIFILANLILHTALCLFANVICSDLYLEITLRHVPGDGRVVRWSLGKLPVPGRPTFWIIVGQGPIAIAVGAGGDCLDIFTLLYPFSSLFPLSLGNGPI